QGVDRARGGARARLSGTSRRLDLRGERAGPTALSTDLRAPPWLSEAVQGFARRLDRPGRRLPGGSNRADLGHEARDRQRAPAARHAQALALRLGDRRARFPPRGPDVRPAADLRQAGPRGRDGLAPGPLRAPRPPLVRLLRSAPDRPAHVPRDGRPPGPAVLPRLRVDLLLPEHPDG